METKRNNHKLLVLALTGVAIGAAAWLLLKTDKGNEIGNSIAKSLKKKMNDTIEDFSGQTGKLINELKNILKL